MQTMIELTDRFPMKFDVDRMKSDLQLLENHKWIDHYDKSLADGWTALLLVSHDGSMDRIDSQRLGKWGHYQRTPVVDTLPYFREILDAFQCPHGRIRIMKLMPGTIIKPHRDIMREVACYAFGQVRLHIPIQTNENVVFSVGGENLKLNPGGLYYVNFTKIHHVRNDGDKPRIHLVLDLKVNDFLRSVFPPLTQWERLENFAVRNALPSAWYVREAKLWMSGQFWKRYEGSRLQRLRHRVISKLNSNHPGAS